MNHEPLESRRDEWADWLLYRRHAQDPAYERRVSARVDRFRDHVLDGARLSAGMTLADIGSGEGLIAFGAIDRIGPSLRAILVDVSLPLLRRAEALATERGLQRQCTFLHSPADKLPGIPDTTVDVVTTRSTLAYVAEKGAAFREFFRILKPGGCLSIAEPIFMDDAYEVIALRKTLDAQPLESRDRFLPLLHRWKAAQFPDTEELLRRSPLTNYSERDLVRCAAASGFSEIHMEFHIDIFRSIMTTWDVFLGSSPHPWAPSVGTILEEQFTAEERKLFEEIIRPAIEDPKATTTERIAYITARKPQG